jgi:hypothetical protein
MFFIRFYLQPQTSSVFFYPFLIAYFLCFSRFVVFRIVYRILMLLVCVRCDSTLFYSTHHPAPPLNFTTMCVLTTSTVPRFGSLPAFAPFLFYFLPSHITYPTIFSCFISIVFLLFPTPKHQRVFIFYVSPTL